MHCFIIDLYLIVVNLVLTGGVRLARVKAWSYGASKVRCCSFSRWLVRLLSARPSLGTLSEVVDCPCDLETLS